jgi:hypothetical protein
MLGFLSRNKLFAFAMILNIMALSSCEGAAAEELLRGEVDLSLSSGTEIEVKSAVVSSEFDHYRFKFSGVDDYGSSDFYTYGDVLMPMEWYYGIYTLYAESCTKEEAEEGYGCIRHEGESSPFSVINDVVSSVSVVCNVANCRVNVKFDDSMYESFAGFKLKVRTVPAPVDDDSADDEEQSAEVLVQEEVQTIRELDFDPVNQVGYYNLQDYPINLHYTLYLLNFEAEEYMESISGYFEENGEPAVINPADGVTFNVKYIGEPIISPNIKFIIEGERKPVQNNITLGDYTQGGIKEDK